VPWWLEEGIRDRNHALLELGERFFAELTVSRRARLISQLGSRYASTAWRFDEAREEMPEHYRNTPHEYLWRAFKSGAAMPLCERRLRHIIAR